MMISPNSKRPLGPTGRRSLRQPLRVCALHKALRQPRAGPITDPADVVYECLTLLRRPDVESLAPFFPAGAFDPSVRRVALEVGGQLVEEAGPLACCHRFMDTAARRVLPGHLLRRCRVLSIVVLGDRCQQRVALTACTGEEAVFVWRLRRVAHGAGPGSESRSWPGSESWSESVADGDAATIAERRTGGSGEGRSGRGTTRGATGSARGHAEAASRGAAPEGNGSAGAGAAAGPSPSSSGSTANAHTSRAAAAVPLGEPTTRHGPTITAAATPSPHATLLTSSQPISELQSPSSPSRSQPDTPAMGSSSRSRDEDPADLAELPLTAWIVESVARDDSYDEDELPPPGPAGGGPHPRCSPELVVKAQLAALRRGDVVGAASYNLWSRSTSGGWELHLSAFRSLLRQPAYAALREADGVELGPSALPSSRRMLQEVRLAGRRGSAAARAGGGAGSAAAVVVYQLGMQANGCWLVEAIRAA